MTRTDRDAPTLVQRALKGHAAIGLLVGALMYLVVLSGTLVVIGPRWDRWEQPRAPEMHHIAPAAVQHAVAVAGGAHPAAIMVTLPDDELPRTIVTAGKRPYFLDASGNRAQVVAHPWADFLLALHIYLNLPATLGLVVVGALGSMLSALIVTGVIAHPRLFRDAFRLRARANRQLAQADWHNRLGIWTLPFGLAVALTGAFLGLAVVGATLIAKGHHGGDVAQVYAPIFGDQVAPGGGPAKIADVAAALTMMQARFPDVTPSYVSIAGAGRQEQRIEIIADVPHRLIYGESYRFDAAGHYLGKVGLSDGAVGQQVAASMYRLHFGSFGGLAVELAYVLFGLCLLVVTGTGMSLWLHKRRRRGEPSVRLEAFWTIIVWGAPLLIVIDYWIVVAWPTASATWWFWSLLAALVIVLMIWPHFAKPSAGRRVLGASILVTGVAHAALMRPSPASFALDLVIALTGIIILVAPGLLAARRTITRAA